MLGEYSHLKRLAGRIRALPTGVLTREQLLVRDFFLYRQGQLEIYYAPFDFVNESARLVLLGITPGFTQMRIAFEATRDELRHGASLTDASRAVKERASSAVMRKRICRWLDELEVPSALGVDGSEQLFNGAGHLLHTTSAVRYPVVTDGRNYSGGHPRPRDHPELRRYLIKVLAPELERIPDALIVPLGKSASGVITFLAAEGLVHPRRCLAGFPHPSGANAGGARQSEKRAAELREQVRTWAKAERDKLRD